VEFLLWGRPSAADSETEHRSQERESCRREVSTAGRHGEVGFLSLSLPLRGPPARLKLVGPGRKEEARRLASSTGPKYLRRSTSRRLSWRWHAHPSVQCLTAREFTHIGPGALASCLLFLPQLSAWHRLRRQEGQFTFRARHAPTEGRGRGLQGLPEAGEGRGMAPSFGRRALRARGRLHWLATALSTA